MGRYKSIVFYIVITILFIGKQWTGSLYAQTKELSSEHFSVNEGLSSRLISDILLADDMVWLGTDNGLNRFDGYNFTLFNQNPENQPRQQLSANKIDKLRQNKAGNIVITFQNTILFFDIFNPRSNAHQKVDILPQNQVKGVPQTLEVDNNGDVFIYTKNDDEGHIYHYNIDSNHFELLFQIYDSSSIGSSTEILHFANGFFLINNSQLGLRLFDISGQQIKAFSRDDFSPPSPNFLYPRNTYFLHQDRQSRIWLSFRNNPGLYWFDPIELNFSLVPSIPQDKFFTSLWEDKQGNILVAQTAAAGNYPPLDDLYCITQKGKVKDFGHILNISKHITSCHADDFFKTIFLGLDTGFEIVQNYRPSVNSFLADSIPLNQRGVMMMGLTSDGKNTIYATTENDKWYAIDAQTNVLDTLLLIDQATGLEVEFGCGNKLYHDDKGFVWGLGCTVGEYSTLIGYDTENCMAKTYVFTKLFTTFDVDTTSHTFWLASNKGQLFRFFPHSEKIETFTDLEGKNPFNNTRPQYILYDNPTTLWVGTDKGLFKINPQTNIVKVYRSSNKPGLGILNGNTIYTIYKNHDGKIWVGTQNGLNILDPKTDKVEYFTKEQGLPANSICGIVAQDSFTYWISTYNGLSFFDLQNQTFQNFYKSDGLTSDEFNRFSYLKHKEKLYFGGTNGLNIFSPEELLIEKEIPRVKLTQISRYNSKLDSLIIKDTDLDNIDVITISPSDAYFDLYFSLPVYRESKKNQYKYFLEGYDKDWIYWGKNHSIRYHLLPAGKYTLHILGADVNGRWGQEALSIDIFVEQVFYKTWTFIIILLLALSAIVYGIFHYQLEQRLAVERLRAKLASDLHDELSGLLTGIAMQTDMLSALGKEPKFNQRLKKIGTDSRTALSRMSDVIWSVDSRKDKLEDLMNRMREHADEILVPLNIRYTITAQNIDQNQKVPAYLKQDLYFIYKEVINNVAKHSGAQHVSITLKNNQEYFRMVIKDNGKGVEVDKMKGATPKGGQGMLNLKMRAQRLGAELSFFNEDGFIVTLIMKRFI